LPILREMIKKLNVYCGEKEAPKHRIITVNSSWEEYLALRGSNFRNRFRKIERKLDRIGNWTVIRAEKPGKNSEICKKIFKIEQASWKSPWMSSQGIEEDLELSMLLTAMCNVGENKPRFSWRAYILKLKDDDIAYVLAFRIKHTWFVKRTSYDQRYKSLYPGLLIMNHAISDLFSPDVTLIDFCTDHSYLEVWAKNRLSRTALFVSKSYMLSFFTRVTTNSSVTHVWRVAMQHVPKVFRTSTTNCLRGLL